MKQLALALLLVAAGCNPAEPVVREQTPRAKPTESQAASGLADPGVDEEQQNLLSLARGAVALKRTAEATYESSAVHAIDGTPATYWSSPVEGPEQTLAYALPALTRLTRIGASTAKGASPDKLRFEISNDGHSWTHLGTMNVQAENTQQTYPVSATTRFVRVATVVPSKKTFVVLRSLLAVGEELEPAGPGSIAGCWSLDGVPARFAQDGARVTGVILDPERPILLDGGTEGRVNLLLWLQTPMWGHAAVTVSRDGRHLSGLKWHEDVIWDHAGDGWMGTRTDCADAAFQKPAIAEELLRRAGRYALFGLRFDDQDRLIPAASAATLAHLAAIIAHDPASRFRLVAREFHKPTAAENEQSTQRRLDSLREALRTAGADLTRLDFLAAGSKPPGRSTATEPEKLMVGTVELELQ